VQAFSGVLCIDEVYQGQLAFLFAVDPAAPDGDRLVALPNRADQDLAHRCAPIVSVSRDAAGDAGGAGGHPGRAASPADAASKTRSTLGWAVTGFATHR